ncbi:MAG: hypothetical protein KC419_19895, partial [Anaerolineales bacterium]|nr:hypothetical protein [Anaerolineales bacterium]
MSYRQISTFMLLLLLVLPILVSCEDQTVTPVPPTVFIQDGDNKGLKALALRDSVTLVRGISSQKLVLLETTDLAQDDQLTVIDAGRALLAISDSLIVELIREGNLTVQELTVDEETVLLALAMKSGAVLNDLNIEDAIEGLLKIEGEYATITATGTTFLVVKEENTPLEWVVALDSTPSDLMVTADNVATEIVTGKAVWVAPFGPPGPVIDANINAVNDWIDGLRNGSDMPELGETVWDYAEMEIPASELPDPVPVDTPIDVREVALTLDPAGSYERVDCNGDG